MAVKRYRIPEEEITELISDMGGCLATNKITMDGERIGYMYREEPSNEYDSGWRFLSGTESPEYLDDPDNMALHDVNTICNYDRAIIPYLHADDNSAFERITPEKFIEVPFDPEDDDEEDY